jgi:hypothetical protein
MLIYKFRITLEENDNFLREIEIKPGQTFEDFHVAIQNSVNTIKGEMASFFICDSKWKKHQEITLVKTDAEPVDRELNAGKPPVILMSETKLSSCIDSPNAQMIYVYDIHRLNTFYIELFKIYNIEENITIPRLLKSVSDVPKAVTQITSPEEIIIDYDESIEEVADEIDESRLGEEDTELFGDLFEEPNPTDGNEGTE